MPFAIERQSGSNIIRARMSHLFTLGDASGLMQAYIRTLGNSGPGAESLDLLVDVSNAPIQSGEVILALSDFLRQPQYRPARIAFVHGGKAIKMQARRVSADLGGRHFSTEAEALAWLASDERRTT